MERINVERELLPVPSGSPVIRLSEQMENVQLKCFAESAARATTLYKMSAPCFQGAPGESGSGSASIGVPHSRSNATCTTETFALKNNPTFDVLLTVRDGLRASGEFVCVHKPTVSKRGTASRTAPKILQFRLIVEGTSVRS